MEMESAELAYRPSSVVPVEEAQAGGLMRLIESLEDSDDVSAVHANFDVPAEVLERSPGSDGSTSRAANGELTGGGEVVGKIDSGSLRPPVVILCGGRGTRLQEHTREIPKPLVEIGGEPIVGHVIRVYAAQRFTRFVLATGYRGA